ncbi:MAG: hypothetical protein F2667_11855 [Actinobacteria bacterium]|nr:hypothetical protein [Actinomycetota bacterium]
MTSLLPSARPRAGAPSSPGDRRHQRPLTAVATLGGALAAGTTLLVCVALGVVGWFLTDAGAHGTPRDGLRTGALGWLMGHGSGVHVTGTAVTAVPLGVTLLCAWSLWRVGHRVGDAISGHGPDADRIGDGERDWTVPMALGLFVSGYAVVAVVVSSLTATASTAPDTGAVVRWSIVLGVIFGGSGLAVGSGRAAIWSTYVPPTLLAAAATARRILLTWLAVAASGFVAALVVDVDTAANILSQLHTDAADATLFVLLSLLVVPNAVAFSGSYLLGPGFSMGVGTLVSPSAVVLGPLPMFPLLAALPDNGTPPGWTAGLVALPPLVGALGAVQAQRRMPTLRWDEGALRGCVGGAGAGIVFAVLAAVAGGAVGPGRMRDVAPMAGDVLVHAITSFGLGGLIGGLIVTAWQRRAARDLTGH